MSVVLVKFGCEPAPAGHRHGYECIVPVSTDEIVETLREYGLEWQTEERVVVDEPVLVDAEKVWLAHEDFDGGGGGMAVFWKDPNETWPGAYPDAEVYWLIPHKEVAVSSSQENP